MQIKDLLEFELLPGLRILAGEEGVNREVSSVSVMDAPDICDWMRGEELLITSGYTIKTHPVDLEKLITDLNSAQVAGLGIKVDRFIYGIPEQVLDTANRLGFPVLYIPKCYSFVDIINPILTEIISRQARELLYSEKIHQAFINLALGEKSIQEVVDQLSRIIQKDIIYKDPAFHHTYLSHQADTRMLTAKTTAKYQIATAKKSYGCLYVLNNSDLDIGRYERIAIEHARTVLILIIQEKMSNREIERRYRSELIHDILTNNCPSLEEIQSRAALYGWMFKRGMRVIVYDIDHFKIGYLEKTTGDRPLEWIHGSMIQIIKTHLSTAFQCYYIYYSDTIVFLIEYYSADEKTVMANLVQMNDEINSEIEAETGYTTTIGVGDYKSGVEEAANSYAEASTLSNML